MSEMYGSRTLRELVRVLAGRFLGMTLILLVLVAAAVVGTLWMSKTYRTEATLIARPARDANVLTVGQATSVRDEIQLFVATQREIVLSDYVLATALMRLDGADLSKLNFNQLGALAAQTRQREEAVQKFVAENAERLQKARKRVAVLTPGGPGATFSQTFTIRVDWPEEPKEAAKAGKDSAKFAVQRAHAFASALVESYVERRTQLDTEQAASASEFLSTQALTLAAKERDAASADYDAFVKDKAKEDLPVIKVLSQGDTGTQEIGDVYLARTIQNEINTIDTRTAEVQALKASIDEQLKKPPAELAVPDAVAAANPTITTLEAKIIDLQLMVNNLAPRYTDDYQELRSSRAELDAARKDLVREMSRQSAALDTELATLKARRGVLEKELTATKARLTALAAKVAEYEAKIKVLEAAQSNYDELKKRTMEASTAEKLAANPVLVTPLDRPYLPDPQRPHRPIFWLNVLVALAAGLILAVVYAFTADHFDHTLKSVDDAERHLGVPVLASVPKLGRGIIRKR